MGAHCVSDSSTMQTSVSLVACLASCLATSLALSQSHHYLPWFGYQSAPTYRFPGVDRYHHYYPNYDNNNNYNHYNRLRQHPVAAVPVLPEVTLESGQESPPPAPPGDFSHSGGGRGWTSDWCCGANTSLSIPPS